MSDSVSAKDEQRALITSPARRSSDVGDPAGLQSGAERRSQQASLEKQPQVSAAARLRGERMEVFFSLRRLAGEG